MDYIASCDFIATYGKNFGITSKNLHGDNEFSFNEFAARRNLISQAIKSLVLQDFIFLSIESDGFYYFITERGIDLCGKMDTEYATSYLKLCHITNAFLETKNEVELLDLIRKKAIEELQRR